MVLSFHANMICRMKVKQQELLPKGYASKEQRQVIPSLNTGTIKGNGWCRVNEEGHGDGGVLKVVEMVRWDGAIHIKRLVPNRANEELHGYGDGAPYHDQKELQIPYFWGGEPWVTSVGVGVLSMKLDMVKEVPQPN